MLISCPECNKQISDKAISCPSCGYPIQTLQKEPVQTSPQAPKKRKQGRMRLPNGFGRITEIKGRNLRRPFRAMVSDGKDETGHPIGKLLKPQAYFRTYNEAYKALIEYNQNPYDYKNDITMSDLYEKWYLFYSPKISKSRQDQIKASWKYCEELIGNRPVQVIRTPEIRRLFDDAYKLKDGEKVYPSDNTKSHMKYTLSMMLDYAVEYGYTDRNYARDIKTGYGSDTAAKPHIAYSKEELTAIWNEKCKSLAADMTLVQCFMGWRPGEVCSLRLNKVDMTSWTIAGGSKTAAGKDRVAVIHEVIRPIIRHYYDKAVMSGSEYLFTKDRKPIQYQIYNDYFNKMLDSLNLNEEHRPHDARKQFVTMAKASGVDEYAIKIQIGHAIKDLTERVYTERDIAFLQKEIGKINPVEFLAKNKEQL